MNGILSEGGGDEACANCGRPGSDAVKLKNCTACRLVKYCGVGCHARGPIAGSTRRHARNAPPN